MKYTFTPNIKTIDKFADPVRRTEVIKNEPMIFSGSPRFAHVNGGPLTREVTNLILKNEYFRAVQSVGGFDYNIVIDTRVTMTMPGMYPSIPGWHCDDVPRSKTHGQPVLHGVDSNVQHFMVLLSDQEDVVSCTEFVTEPFEVDVDIGDVWGSVDRAVESEKPKTGFLTQGEIIRFNQEAIHRASMTSVAGWRFFYRASITHRAPSDEIRKQVQVYTSSNGW